MIDGLKDAQSGNQDQEEETGTDRKQDGWMTSGEQQVHSGRGRHKIGGNGRHLQRATSCSGWTKPLMAAMWLTAFGAGADDGDDIDEAPVHHILDVLAVVDKPMLDYWIEAPGAGSREKVIEEIKSLFFEINFVFQSLREFNLNVEIRLEDIVFPNSSIVPVVKVENNVVDSITAGMSFARYLNQHRYTYDHAMYITKYDLHGYGVKDTKGVGKVNSACKNFSISRIEGRRDYNTVRIAAHELGHCLGANHDNVKDSKCKGKYIMSTGVKPAGDPKFWYFSKCTATAIKKYIKSLGKNNCLERSNNPSIISKRMGELVDKDDMCRRLYGSKVSPFYASGDKLCYKLRCLSQQPVEPCVTPEGVKCAQNKKCFMGHCV
ncbi:A disintegrin and metalloproteinase with thrombospondin motifs 6 [Plakobranchus ocellatus]|uniref:A disintegrin and metalloproteinase with thrombospondin motifs 6 n=1 Tax=Plakobranchus ocellatus TaxID=259542 RepID=A0AAV3Z530_9GAST|nr:A disintegrin and metalloproteinase with thrombospondin motifs 6 [Plakobranchus ocellatus]